jgi:hypothetical protein
MVYDAPLVFGVVDGDRVVHEEQSLDGKTHGDHALGQMLAWI